MIDASKKFGQPVLEALASILINSPVIVFQVRYTDGWPLVFISENISNFGYDANDLINNSTLLKELIRTDKWENIENSLRTRSKASVLFSDFVILKDLGGDNHIIEMHLRLVRERQSNESYIQGTIQETEFGEGSYPFPVDEKNVDLYEQLVSLVRLIPAPALVVYGHHYYANAHAFNLTGFSRKEINTINDWFYALNSEQGQEMEDQYYKDRFQAVKTWQVQFSDGLSRWITFYIYPISSMELWMWIDTTDLQKFHILDQKKEQINLLRKLVDSLPLMITMYDKTNQLTFVNNTFTKETGYDYDYIQTHNIFDKLFPDSSYRAKMHNLMYANASEWHPVSIETRHGKILQGSWNNFSISEDIRIGVGINKSLAQDLENSLQLYRKQFQIIANQMEDVVFTIDTDKRYSSISGLWLDRVGLTQDDFLGKTANEVFGEIGARIHTLYHEKVLRGIPSTYEFMTSKDGINRWMQSSVSPLRDQRGVIIGAIGISREITSLKTANERLNMLDYALQVSANAIVIADEEGKIFWANDALSTLTGYELSEVIGKHTRIFKSGKQPDTFYKNLWETIIQGNVWKGELINRKKDGSLYVEEQTITPFIGLNGKPFFIAVKQDVTNRIEKEKNLHDAYKEKQILLEEVHHRVKNNLALVHGLLDLQMASSSDHDAEILRRSQQRIHTMALIHENLYQQDNVSDIIIPEYIDRLLKDTDKAYQMPGQKINIHLTCDSISMNINQAIPFALICNEMITNAYVHAFKTKKTGTIDVSIISKDSQIELRVQDNGMGIYENSELDSHRTLGKTIMEELTKQLNGKLTIKSDGGTVVDLIFTQQKLKGSHSYNL